MTDKIIARASVSPMEPAEEGVTGEPDVMLLYLDDDDTYRWYHEDGTSTDVAAKTTRSALAEGNLAWRNFELMEYRGRLVEAGEEIRIANIHAHDERQRLQQE